MTKKLLALFGVFALLATTSSYSADRKPIEAVDVDALTSEGQVMSGGSNMLDLVWWIPIEFWQASLTGDPNISEFQRKQVIDTLGPYSVLAVVQANISSFGAFSFFGEDAISSGMRIEYIDEDGNSIVLSHKEKASPDAVILLNQMVPILSAAMGEMGQNFYFFPLPNLDDNGDTVVSPYAKGLLRITLDTRADVASRVLEIELPLDALYVPRPCPNGKAAHVSWTHCPWDGSKLPD